MSPVGEYYYTHPHAHESNSGNRHSQSKSVLKTFLRNNQDVFVTKPIFVENSNYNKLSVKIAESVLRDIGLLFLSSINTNYEKITIPHAYVTAEFQNVITGEYPSVSYPGFGSVLNYIIQGENIKAVLGNSNAYTVKVDLSEYDNLTGLTGFPKAVDMTLVVHN